MSIGQNDCFSMTLRPEELARRIAAQMKQEWRLPLLPCEGTAGPTGRVTMSNTANSWIAINGEKFALAPGSTVKAEFEFKPKGESMRYLYRVYLIHLPSSTVEAHLIIAKSPANAQATAMMQDSVRVDDIDEYHVHVEQVCDVPEYKE